MIINVNENKRKRAVAICISATMAILFAFLLSRHLGGLYFVPKHNTLFIPLFVAYISLAIYVAFSMVCHCLLNYETFTVWQKRIATVCVLLAFGGMYIYYFVIYLPYERKKILKN